jgi:hypothetical protein
MFMVEKQPLNPENEPNEASDKYLYSLTQFHEIARQARDERGLDLANHAIADELRRRAGGETDPNEGPVIDMPLDPQAVTIEEALKEQEEARKLKDPERLQQANRTLLWLSEQFAQSHQGDQPPNSPNEDS